MSFFPQINLFLCRVENTYATVQLPNATSKFELESEPKVTMCVSPAYQSSDNFDVNYI